MSIINKIFGQSEKKILKQYQPIVGKINNLEKEFESFSDEQLKEKAQELKKRLLEGLEKNAEKIKEINKQIVSSVDQENRIKIKKRLHSEKKKNYDQILPEAFAIVRESSKRALGMRHFDVQLIGGMVLHEGGIAEMKTGEGKTLAATLAVFLNALEEKGAHVITVNDYLAKRDANWMAPVYYNLGLSVGCIQHDAAFVFDPQVEPDKNEVSVEMENLRPVSRKEAYACDIVYGTNNEFGFDYLRDNLVLDPEQMSQRHHHFAIVDEVDSILIDEARTPLIISAPDTNSSNKYAMVAQKILPLLTRIRFVTNVEEAESKKFNTDIESGYDIIANEEKKSALLTQEGQDKVENVLGIKGLFEGFDSESFSWKHAIDQCVKAKVFFIRDKNYVVKDGSVVIVDDFTGRLMPGRRYSEGLHQAIEAKEGLEVQKESRTLATITFQNYFRFYEKLSGMTGTASTNAEEFNKVYGLDVATIPPNKPVIRKDLPDSIYKSELGKFKAVIRKIKECNQKGQPVLVGTISVEKSEMLSQMLKREGVEHEVLNAKNHEREAAIVSKAGEYGAVTIATNMAGRGTDIKLGKGVKEAGGLFVLGTERHEARRIDNQLRGRSGRQGDPGTSQFYVSMEDDLMRIFGSDKIRGIMDRFNFPEDQPIENKILSKSIENAQGKIEGYNFDARNHLLEYDDVMNKQRDAIYKKRRQVLDSLKDKESQEALKNLILDFINKEIADIILVSVDQDGNVDLNLALKEVKNIIEVRKDEIGEGCQNLQSRLQEIIRKKYDKRENEFGENTMRNIEKLVALRIIDMLWMQHLDYMEHLRNSVSLRGFGQRDPLVEYKKEGIAAFHNLLKAIQSNIARNIFKAGFMQAERNIEQEKKERSNLRYSGDDDSSSSSTTVRNANKVGRNDPCPCGSGKKYKKCCGA